MSATTTPATTPPATTPPATTPPATTPPEKKENTDKKGIGSIGGFLLFILILLVFLSIMAMIWSLICFGKSGTMVEKIVGVVIAFFVGPFYFIYYLANKEYCR